MLASPALAEEPAPLAFTSTGRPQTVTLTRVGDDAPVAVCVTPCSPSLEPGRYRYRAEGRRIRTYEGSVIVPSAHAITLRDGSRPAFVTGLILTGLGAAGTALMGAASVFLLASGDDYNQSMGAIYGGSVVVLWGPMLAIGIALVTGNSKGPVDVSF